MSAIPHRPQRTDPSRPSIRYVRRPWEQGTLTRPPIYEASTPSAEQRIEKPLSILAIAKPKPSRWGVAIVASFIVSLGVLLTGTGMLWSKGTQTEAYPMSEGPDGLVAGGSEAQASSASSAVPEPVSIPPMFMDSQAPEETPPSTSSSAAPTAFTAPPAMDAGDTSSTAVQEPALTDTPPAVATPRPRRAVYTSKAYKVGIYQERGDTLWRIADRVYNDRSKWRIIYLANRDLIRDPNKIYPKQKLKIPASDWQP